MKLMMPNNNWMNSWILNAPNIEKSLPVLTNYLMLLMFSFPTSFTNSEVQSILEGVQHHLCALSHGQSAAERGFSINKEVLVENLQEKSLVSQRMLYDHINSNKINIHEYELPSDLLKSCKLSDRHYNAALEETKKRENWYGSQKTKIDRRGHSSCKEEKR